MTVSMYDPASYPRGVPNPYGPRVHAWNGGPWDQGTRYHGSVWTRPQWDPRWAARPFAGLGATTRPPPVDIPDKCWQRAGFTPCYERVLDTAWDWCEEPLGAGGYPRWQEEYGSVEACADLNARWGTKEYCAQYCPELGSDPNLPYYIAAGLGVLMIGAAMALKQKREK